MAQSKAAFGHFGAASQSATRRLGATLGNVRVVVVASLILISGSFASAAIIQLRLDREHALAQAAAFDVRRANSLAAELASALDAYAAIGRGFASSSLDAESAAALSEAGGPAMRNIAVLDSSGRLLSELKGAPQGLLPLSSAILAQARTGTYLGPSSDGRNLVMVLSANAHIVAIAIDVQSFVASTPDALIAMPSGRLLALGREWRDMPDVASIALPAPGAVTRILEFPNGARQVSLARSAAWPLVTGTSVD